MVEDFQRQSPLAHRGLASLAEESRREDHGIALAERPFSAIINLRGDPSNKPFLAAVKKALGQDLPLEANRFNQKGGMTTLWLGPDEWWVLSEEGDGPGLAAKLEAALGEIHASAVDVSEYYTAIELSGPKSREVLAKGSSIDFHPRVFSVGMAAQTLYAKADATILQLSEDPLYSLYVRRSFADYVWAWISDASREYGYTVLK